MPPVHDENNGRITLAVLGTKVDALTAAICELKETIDGFDKRLQAVETAQAVAEATKKKDDPEVVGVRAYFMDKLLVPLIVSFSVWFLFSVLPNIVSHIAMAAKP